MIGRAAAKNFGELCLGVARNWYFFDADGAKCPAGNKRAIAPKFVWSRESSDLDIGTLSRGADCFC